MRIEKVKAGEVIAKRQDKVMEWFLIQEGTVIQKFEAAEMELNKNSMIGILENDRFICDYVAREECVLIVIECKNARDLQNILAEHSNFRAVFLRAALEQRHKTLCLYAELLKKSNLLHDRAQKYYEDYNALCEEMLMQEIASLKKLVSQKEKDADTINRLISNTERLMHELSDARTEISRLVSVNSSLVEQISVLKEHRYGSPSQRNR